MKPHPIIALLLAISPLLHGSPESDKALIVLAAKLARSEKVTDVKSVKELSWMVGRWKCTERILRGPRDIGMSGLSLAFLDTVEVDEEHVAMKTETMGTFSQHLQCTSLGRQKTARQPKDFTLCEIDAKGYRFAMPDPDWLWLKKEPVEKPSWFILQHQDTGDVLLFERVPESDRVPKR